MGLREMMEQHRDEILRITLEALGKRPTPYVTARELDGGIPVFYEQVISTLRSAEQVSVDVVLPPPSLAPSPQTPLTEVAAEYGKELRRLGFSASQVVHVYAALCDALTRTAKLRSVLVDATEFNLLNRCLDHAIGEAVTEFEAERDKSIAKQQNKHLGFLMHELRNALSNSVFAMQLIKTGAVGPSGRTGEVLERNLARMRDLIDRSLTDVRLRSDAKPRPERCDMADVLEEIELIAAADVARHRLGLDLRAERGLMLDADHHMIISAVANLVQNAIKFTRPGGRIAIRASSAPGNTIAVEVEDGCGGLPAGRADELAHPTAFRTTDPDGMGLGLSIVHQAVRLHQGQVGVTNVPGKGCIFTIFLPRARDDSAGARVDKSGAM